MFGGTNASKNYADEKTKQQQQKKKKSEGEFFFLLYFVLELNVLFFFFFLFLCAHCCKLVFFFCVCLFLSYDDENSLRLEDRYIVSARTAIMASEKRERPKTDLPKLSFSSPITKR